MLRKLEKYEILEEIGHGGMATVYRAHDTGSVGRVRSKGCIPPRGAAEGRGRRFHRGAGGFARSGHPGGFEIYAFPGEARKRRTSPRSCSPVRRSSIGAKH